MRVRYQRGYLRLGQRKTGPDRWEFLWWDSEPSGVRVRRKAVFRLILLSPACIPIHPAVSAMPFVQPRKSAPGRDH